MGSLNHDGVALFYEEAGHGDPPILLLHGMACDHTHFAPQVQHFQQDHRVVALDLRGHGRSDAPEHGYDIAGFADDVQVVARALGLARPVVIGHSLGGMVALELAARYPDLPGAIVALDATIVPPQATFGFLQPFLEGMQTSAYRQVLRQFMELSFAPTDDPHRKARILDAMNAVPEHVVRQTWDNLFTWDSAAAAAACKAPVLYIDAGSPNCDVARFRELCPQLLDGKTVGSGHWHQLEVPLQVTAMIDRFLTVARRQSATAV